MFIQGDLQAVFDALYTLGAIDPVLKMDWNKIMMEMAEQPHLISQAVHTLNQCGGDRNQILQQLQGMKSQTVHYIAMEVAREFCEFQDRQTLH